MSYLFDMWLILEVCVILSMWLILEVCGVLSV